MGSHAFPLRFSQEEIDATLDTMELMAPDFETNIDIIQEIASDYCDMLGEQFGDMPKTDFYDNLTIRSINEGNGEMEHPNPGALLGWMIVYAEELRGLKSHGLVWMISLAITGRGAAWNPGETLDGAELTSAVVGDILGMPLLGKTWEKVDTNVWLRLQCAAQFVVQCLLIPCECLPKTSDI